MFDAGDAFALAGFWSAALGWPIHLDLRTESNAQRDELHEKLIALGGSDVDFGQGDVPWSVMADPEGNEFCVLTRR